MRRPQIVCVSANPAVDRRLCLSSFFLAAVNRARSAEALPGGKAAHVAIAARAMGAQATWIGFLGGPTGEECALQLKRLGVEVTAVPIQAATRLNLEMIEDSGRVTEVLEPGGTPDQRERADMLNILERGLRRKRKGAAVVISGSLPKGVPPSFYRTIISLARDLGSKVFLDTSGEALRAGLKAQPDFVKPNREEAEALFGRALRDLDSAILATCALIKLGAASAVVTLGSEGLVWRENREGPIWSARAPRMKTKSAVGSGDTTLAGFALATMLGKASEEVLRFAAACGAANCVAKQPGQISAATVKSLIGRIKIQRLGTSA
jgi:1-phosphofructokinase family hexose kinase